MTSDDRTPKADATGADPARADAGSPGPAEPTEAVAAIAALGDGLRRRLYQYVRGRPRPVSRDEVAGGVGISSRLAAFHLDKLVRTGLLRAHYARKSGRTGPGAGRSSKFYQPAAVEFQVSIPDRRYDVVGAILVEAVRACDDRVAAPLRRAAERVARERGEQIGRQERPPRRRTTPGLRAVERALARYGFEPRTTGRRLTMANCPFDALARDDPELVCAVNLAFVDGIVTSLAARDVTTMLRPAPGRCCVQLRTPA